MEKVETKTKNEITSKAPERMNNGAINILIAFIETFFTSLIIGWAISIIAFFYLTIKAFKG